jgi:hypothetical protein
VTAPRSLSKLCGGDRDLLQTQWPGFHQPVPAPRLPNSTHFPRCRAEKRAPLNLSETHSVPVPVERRRRIEIIETPEHYRSLERTMGAVQRTGGLALTLGHPVHGRGDTAGYL